jgi:long-chain acyl-CoA synthetase
MSAATADRPWLGAYPPGVPADIDVDQYPSLVHLMEESFQKYAIGRPTASWARN